MNLQVLLTELMSLREDFSIPSSCPVILVSETTCLTGLDEITAGGPELRLLSAAALRTGDTSALVSRIIQSATWKHYRCSLSECLVIFTFPPDLQENQYVLERLARRAEKNVRLRELAAGRVKMLEEKITELEQQLASQADRALDRTRKIVSDWIATCGCAVSVNAALISQLNGQSADFIGKGLALSLELQRFLHPAQVVYTIDSGNFQPVTEKNPVNLSPVTDKAALLLNRYEQAAQKALQLNIPLTGKSVAALCEPPVSPPAITDSLKKYAKQIERLLVLHPGNWSNARLALKQLREMDEKRKYSAA